MLSSIFVRILGILWFP